ncbi:hypothetical protein BDZ91DRAFT_786594 [Kalaharituber pfeilii]|nr:hypothetical protein BDZ91DRAFT_786594 [Kalaharituber pfeilii]
MPPHTRLGRPRGKTTTRGHRLGHGIGCKMETVLEKIQRKRFRPYGRSFMVIQFLDDEFRDFDIQVGGPDDPLPEVGTPQAPEELGFSTITTCAEEPPTSEDTAPATNPHAIPAPDTRPENARNKKRKGKTPSPQDSYAIKRQLDDKEARRIASAPPVGDTAGTAPDNTTPSSSKPTPSPTQKTQTPRTPSRPKTKLPTTPPTPDASTTTKIGIVVHGIALSKDLGKVRRWLEAANQELGKTTGIRWLRKKDTLVNEGKTTSSAVVYLENHTDVGRVRLGGRWLRVDQYEWDRGRK